VLHLRAVAVVGLAVGLAVVAACGGGGGNGTQGDALSVSASVVNFSATQGGATPAQQIVNVVVNNANVFVETTQSGAAFSHSFSITGPTTGQITITASTPSTPGNSLGAITVRGCSTQNCTGSDVPGSPKSITVNYAVAAAPTLTSTPRTVSFFTATGVLPPSQSAALALSTGSTTWTSSIVYTFGAPGWLTVTPPSGLLPQTAVLRVTSTGVGTGTRSANVTFTAGLVTRTVPVTLTVNEPGVYSIAPYIATVGVGGEVFLRGYGFSVLDPSTLQVQFAGARAVTATIVSDTEIRATYAPMNPGVTPANVVVSVRDATTVIPQRSGARFLVVSPPHFSLATIPRPANAGAVGNLIYDAERQAVYLMDADNNRIERYRLGNNSAPETFFYGASLGNPRLALVPGGERLVKTHGNGILLLDAAAPDLANLGFVDAVGLLGAGAILNQIAVANDGGGVGGAFAPNSGISLYRFDVLSQRFSELSTQSDMANRTIAASENGDTLVLATFESLVPSFAKPVFIYNATSAALSQKGVSSTSTERASVSRTGARMILATDSSRNPTTRVYDYDGTTLSVRGDLPTGANGFVVSPDGNTAYVYYSANSTLRKFDLTAPGFPLRASPSVAAPGGQFAQLTISPDGGTIVMAGTENVVVVPAP
jgi:hypothetical protein